MVSGRPVAFLCEAEGGIAYLVVRQVQTDCRSVSAKALLAQLQLFGEREVPVREPLQCLIEVGDRAIRCETAWRETVAIG